MIGFPDMRRGVTINHISDTQQGYRPQFTDNWCERVTKDLSFLREFTDAHIHTGDCIEWNAPEPEDEKYIAFRNGVLESGKPYLDTPGNHDLSTYNVSAPRRFRSANEWASEVPKRQVANQELVIRDEVVVLGISPDYWKWDDSKGAYADPDDLTEAHLAWLNDRLSEHSDKRVWFASHALPSTQLSDTPRFDGTLKKWDDIEELVSAHQNVTGWFSGHWHIDAADPRSIRSIPVGGRRIFGVNAPSSAGLFPGTTASQHQWQRYAGSLYVTDLGEAIEVRWRNHLSATWEAPFGSFVKTFTR